VFVAGATGFIGRAACRALARAGHEVTGLARDAGKARPLSADGVRAVIGTLDEPDSYRKAAGRPEVVVFLAATWFPGRETIEEAERIGARILGWNRGLARLAAESHARIYLFCGSNVGEPRPASSRSGSGRAVIGYQRILEPAQAFLETEARELPVSVILPGWVYGAGSWLPDLVREIRAGRTTHVIDGGGTIPGYVHVDDVGEAFRLAAEKAPAGRSYSIVDEERLSARQFVEAAARQLGAGAPRGVTRAEALAERGEVYAEALTCSVDPGTGPAQRDLGWTPRYPSSREGLPAALRALEG